MAFATALTATSAGSSILGGTLGLIQGIGQANAAKAIGNYQAVLASRSAAISDMNAKRAELDAKVADKNAKAVGLAGQEAAQDQDIEASIQLADIVGAQIASGVRGASSDAVVATARGFAARDRTRLSLQGLAEMTKARGIGDQLRQDASDFRAQRDSDLADMAVIKSNAQSEATSARLGGISSFMQGLSGAGGSLLDGSKSAAVRHDFSRAREWVARQYGRITS